ncbi:2OG-Fe(II) oxygenase [Catenovulum sp. 2E275]|uniref:2OG-Fe(II) oxygenase n=1 Tax=Catenovulum sp. 2E275 TaxID=2980497 RepID=UPI0021D10B68|nr:2OG-Fe(II) oxygenase [Catenovulum sp. 2E275]MCU4676050.1 2OG-Fe(II) oxygenase [Catenovulum sp. 2E275]
MQQTAEQIFAQINYLSLAEDLRCKGYAIIDHALPIELETALLKHLMDTPSEKMRVAGIGREQQQTLNSFVRRDQIKWIEPTTQVEQAWLSHMEALRLILNRQLLLGLFSYESHFAQYNAGDFYKKHLDAFNGQTNRVLSTVYYLNPNWQAEYGGELVMYDPENHTQEIERILPELGRMVIFLSEEFPHEVLPADRMRYSIAGWFRVNNSINNQVDPPK